MTIYQTVSVPPDPDGTARAAARSFGKERTAAVQRALAVAAAGEDAYILASTDGGETWEEFDFVRARAKGGE